MMTMVWEDVTILDRLSLLSRELVEHSVPYLHLDGRYGTECSTNSLDNNDRVDYAANNEAVFNSTILGGNDDHGLGGCNNFDLNVGVTGATATWTGEGTWTPQADKPICVNFYDPEDNKPTCCCDMSKKSLGRADVADLSCSCFM